MAAKAKYHYNPKTGATGLCKASLKDCPFGAERHFPTEAEARHGYEASMQVHTVRRHSPLKRQSLASGPGYRSSEEGPRLDALMDIALLQRMLKERMVSTQRHPLDDNLRVMTYSPMAQMAGRWNEVTKQTRGMIVLMDNPDFSDAVVLERPWRKFFTLEQMTGSDGKPAWALGDEEDGQGDRDAVENLDMNAPAEVTDKVDGSMGVLYRDPRGDLAFATKGSFGSPQAVDYSKLLLRTPKYLESAQQLREANPGTTFVFELIGPENQVVLQYDQADIRFLGAIDKHTGHYRSTSDFTDVWSEEKGLTHAEVMPARNITEALALPDRPNREGVVVRIMSDDAEKQMQVKIKQEDYKKLHRMMTHLSGKTLQRDLREAKPTMAELMAVAETRDVHKLEAVDKLLGPVREGGSAFHKTLYDTHRKNADYAVLPVVDNVKRAWALVESMPQDLSISEREAKKRLAQRMAQEPDKNFKSMVFSFFEARNDGKTLADIDTGNIMKAMAARVKEAKTSQE